MVSAIVLNRDGAALLESFFASLYRHNSWTRLEIIVVDHASSDGSLDVVRRWVKRLPIEVIIRDTNDSFACANNRAAERARGEILLLANNDIVLVEDVIPRMVAAVEVTGGLVGLRQFENGPSDSTSQRPWHHIGVRFFWNPRRRLLVPYNATPQPGDETLATSACRMFAVTGALMMCRRAAYLAVGGMCEEYFYGFEDVDLCCKFRFQLGEPVICLNDLAALHGPGGTRRRTASSRRRAIYRANIETLDRRYGFALWRDLGVAWLGDDGSLRGFAPGVAVLGRSLDRRLEAALNGFAQDGWAVARSETALLVDLTGIDVVIVAGARIRPNWHRRRDVLLCRVAWVCGAVEDWTARYDLPSFDLVVAGDVAAAEQLKCAGVPSVLQSSDLDSNRALLRALIARRRDTLRFAIVASGGDEQRRARELVRALALAGHTSWLARADLSWEIDPADAVVVKTASAPAARSRLVLSCPCEPDTAKAARMLLDAAQRMSPTRMRGPLDPALPDLSSSVHPP